MIPTNRLQAAAYYPNKTKSHKFSVKRGKKKTENLEGTHSKDKNDS
jgi:hypothetical protein